MIISAAGESHQGNREENQDALLCDQEAGLFIVCDGVGGVKGGREAAQRAIEAVSLRLKSHLVGLKELPDEQRCEALSQAIRNSIQHACSEVYHLAQQTPEAGNMGSTLTLLLFYETRAFVGHVGDSRLYLVRDAEVHQLTDDHTFVRELVARGEMATDEVADSPFANVLTRWIGQGETVQVDLLQFEVLPKDAFLLCSDGLEAAYKDLNELASTLSNTLPVEAAQQLINLAYQRDGSDNISALVVHALPDEVVDAAESDRVREVSLSIETLQKLYIFEKLSLHELIHVMERVVVIKEAPDTVVIKEGDTSDSLLVILEGNLVIYRGGSRIRELESGNHVGEIALLTQRPRSATVKTLTPTTLLSLERNAFSELLRSKPDLGVKLMLNLSDELIRRLLITNDQLIGEGELSDDM